MPAHRAAPPPREPEQALHVILTGLAALIVTSIVVLVGFFVVAEERRGQSGGSAAAPAYLAPAAINSRAADPQPLTRQEVFPTGEIRLVAATPYRVTGTHLDSDCARAATGELADLLTEHGCNQIVRATMTAPYGGYRVTAGIFNLTDDTGAAAAAERAGTLIETGRGGFATIDSAGSVPPATPPAQAGWQARGHYLLFCLISRPDGGVVSDDDPYADRITADLIQQYLTDDVIALRSRRTQQ
ncbi:hypothetical protein [Actinoplanes sp. N902-109]|uniref:hypothetical protein n=1 Tax=Actinoplanes sp. (strain N902-109) TaxID=649831 RepID=UPI00032937A2|nr:hypothetical protein [Actinoplanes sp. N902-109]AGL14469.1 hypothetical protein L083_0959 [Actinoplanes sp. N902-109]